MLANGKKPRRSGVFCRLFVFSDNWRCLSSFYPLYYGFNNFFFSTEVRVIVTTTASITLTQTTNHSH